jgi:carboxymethylenebutenolidase
LGALFDLHVRAEFIDRDLDETMATMTDAPYVIHVPVMTGGHGRDAVRAFYGAHFTGKWPADTRIARVARTVGQGRVVDGLIMSFTHDVMMDAILPGVPPTGRAVELPLVVFMGAEGGKVAYERIYWTRRRRWCRSGSWTRGAFRSPGRSRRASCSTRPCRATR